MMKNIKKPYYGAAYYPESWPHEQVPEDIKLMKQTGMNVMRIGEFAWSNMEPSEGSYDFSFLRHVINELDEADIGVIMGTPTCTPPAWLTKSHPEVMIVDSHNERTTHGARRHACPNSPVYREYTKKIVTGMAKAFKDCENIIAWQIDNELYNTGIDGKGCCCDVCYHKFIDYLKEKFGAIENLNKTWGMYLWSQDYTSFDEIPVPRNNVWHHPSLNTEWMLFQARSYKEFSDFQADILHEYLPEDVYVGTDMMPFLGLDYEDMNEKLDIVQFNHYRNSHNLWDIALWSNYMRNIKNKPFWITETATCWGGGVACSHYNDKNFGIANTFLPVILGAEANLYWLWRTHWSGQELMHGSVVNSWGRPMHIYNELKYIKEGFNKAEDMIYNTYPKNSQIAMHVSHHAWTLYMFQPMINGFNYQAAYQNDVFRPLMNCQLRPDVISEGLDIDGYSIVITSFVPCIENKGLNEKMLKWVENGGTWIVGPMTDIRTYEATKYIKAPFGMLEDVTGVKLAFTLPAGGSYDMYDNKGNVLKTKSNANSYDAYIPGKSETLYEYRNDYLEGYSAITRTKVGKGYIILLGTMPESDSFAKFIADIASEKGVYPFNASGNVVCQIRCNNISNEERYFACVEVENREGYACVPFDCTNILTGNEYTKDDKVLFKPFDVMIFRKK